MHEGQFGFGTRWFLMHGVPENLFRAAQASLVGGEEPEEKRGTGTELPACLAFLMEAAWDEISQKGEEEEEEEDRFVQWRDPPLPVAQQPGSVE